MSFLGLVFLFVLVLLLFSWKKRSRFRLARWVALLLLFAYGYLVGGGMAPRFLLDCLQSRALLGQPVWGDKNLIVVLGAGTVRWTQGDYVGSTLFGRSRAMEAARLYQSCRHSVRVCVVMPSGGDPLKNGKSEAEVMALELVQLGVAENDIIPESKSNNTFQNAQFTDELMRAKAFDQIVLVTSGGHMTRSLLYFSHFKINPQAAPADQIHISRTLLPNSFNFLMTDLALSEYVGILRFYIYNFLDLNKKVSQPEIP